MARLGDACEIISGYAFKSDQYVSNGIRIIRIANVQKGYIEDSAPVYYPFDSADANKYALNEGDLLISLTGNVGRVAILTKAFLPAALNQRVACLRIKDNMNLDNSFLFNLLNSNYFEQQCIAASKGVAQKNMSTEWLKDYEIPMLPIVQQRKIASVLDKVSNLICLRKQQLAKLDQLVKSRFIEMFGESRANPKGWDTIQLEQLADVGSSKRVFVEELQKDGIPFYRGTEVGALAEGQQITPELYITEEHYRSLTEATGAPAKGDLLMPSICSDGRIWLVDTDNPFYFKDGRVLWVHPTSSKIDSCYLQYVLKEKIMTDYDSIASGTTFAELKIFALKLLRVMMPPMELQQQFAAFVEQVDKSKLAVERGLQELEILKKSLMQKYFG